MRLVSKILIFLLTTVLLSFYPSFLNTRGVYAVNQRFLVAFYSEILTEKNKEQFIEKSLDCHFCEIENVFAGLGLAVVSFKSTDALERLSSNPLIASIVPLNKQNSETAPAATLGKQKQTSQIKPYTKSWGLELIESLEANKITRGKGSKILMIDTGVDRDHPDLSDNIAEGRSFLGADYNKGVPYEYFDDQGHGTRIAGIMVGDGSRGVLGVAPEAELFVAKACRGRGCGIVPVTMAINWGVELGVDVINMSLGWSEGTRAGDIVYQRVREAGIVIVAASGNSAECTMCASGMLQFPAEYPETIAVGGIDKNLQRAKFSQYGNSLNISAPSVSIYSSAPIGTGLEVSFKVRLNSGIFDIDNRPLEGSAFSHKPIAERLVNGEFGLPKDFAKGGFRGNVALVARGKANFKDMAKDALAAGAVGLVVYDNLPDGITLGKAKEDGDSDYPIPIIMVENKIGKRLIKEINFQKNGVNTELSSSVTNYEFSEGTSEAAAFVSGSVALIKSVCASLKPKEVEDILDSTSTPSFDKDLLGVGILNTKKAVLMAKKSCLY